MNFSITKVNNGFTVTVPGKQKKAQYDYNGYPLPAQPDMHVFTTEESMYEHLSKQFKGNE